MTTAKVSFQNICKSFGDNTVLSDVCLDIQTGESMVILGGSGTGKSVLLKCMMGLLSPDKGQIYIDGINTTHMGESDRAEVNKNIGMLFQNGALFDSMTVAENIAFALTAGRGKKLKQVMNTVYDCLNKVGLKNSVAHKSPADLSGGMRKRVALARAIAATPDIILFDEPTTGLDPITTTTIDELIQHTVKSIGATAISITHDIDSTRRVADRVAFLYQGKIVWHGTVAQMDNTDNPFVHQFIRGLSDGPIEWAKGNLNP